MALEKTTEIDQIEVVKIGNVQVREATVITENGQEISRTFHRYLLFPGQDVSDQPQKVQDICNVSWTDKVIAEYQAMIAEMKANMPDIEL